MQPWTDRNAIQVNQFGSRGRGVVATVPARKGTLLERSPVLLIPDKDRALVDSTIIFTYVFMWEHGTVEEDLYKHAGRAAIALGYTSLLNHSASPNCTFVRHMDEGLIDLITLRDVEAGEELTIDYQMTHWFKPD